MSKISLFLYMHTVMFSTGVGCRQNRRDMGNGDRDSRDSGGHSGGGRGGAKSPADCNSNHVAGSRVIMPVSKLNHERRHSHSPSTSATPPANSSILDLSGR